MLISRAFITTCLLLPGAAFAQSETDREAEMFGAPADEPGRADSTRVETTPAKPSPEPRSSGDPKPDNREAEMFGAPGTSPSPTPPSTQPPTPSSGLLGFGGLGAESLAIGGRLLSRLETTLSEETDLKDQFISAPNLFDVYLDGRPTDRLRVYFRGRILYTPTAGGGNQSTSDGSTDPLAGLSGQQVTRQLDQLWMKFDVDRTYFFTIGAQPIRWSTGRVWTPTDFVNQNLLDPLALADLRTGVGAARMHVPLFDGTVNLYTLLLFDGANTLGDVGGAFRLEGAVDTAEVALSAATGRGQPARVGVDLSAGVGPIELRGEVALSSEQQRLTPDGLTSATVQPWLDTLPEAPAPVDHPFVQAMTGFEWEISYGEDDSETLFLGAEYYYNQAGITNPEVYPALLLTGNYRPFYVGEHYGAVFLLLPSPGDWDASSFILTAISNLSDRSGVVRLNTSFTVLDKLSVQPFVSGRFGPKGSEFRLALDLPAVGDLTPEVSVPAPIADVGIWLSLGF
ncbi:MAG: hypothetical protein ACE366_13260 [Bradymonadia bacterium]